MTGEWGVIYLLLVHWIADFLLQSDWMAVNKSKRLDALLLHVLTYTAVLALCSVPVFPVANLLPFAGINGGAHLATDFITSKATARLYQAGQRHWFFVVIGFDQFLHQAVLVGTYAAFASRPLAS